MPTWPGAQFSIQLHSPSEDLQFSVNVAHGEPRPARQYRARADFPFFLRITVSVLRQSIQGYSPVSLSFFILDVFEYWGIDLKMCAQKISAEIAFPFFFAGIKTSLRTLAIARLSRTGKLRDLYTHAESTIPSSVTRIFSSTLSSSCTPISSAFIFMFGALTN